MVSIVAATSETAAEATGVATAAIEAPLLTVAVTISGAIVVPVAAAASPAPAPA